LQGVPVAVRGEETFPEVCYLVFTDEKGDAVVEPASVVDRERGAGQVDVLVPVPGVDESVNGSQLRVGAGRVRKVAVFFTGSVSGGRGVDGGR